jgi:hypothetical protein
MPIAEELQVIIRAEVSNAVKGIDTVNKKTQEATKQQGYLQNQLKSVGVAMLGTFAATKILSAIQNFSAVSSKAASDAEEINSKFIAVFKNLSSDTEEWATTYSRSVGSSITESKKFLATIQDTLVPLGFARDAAAGMSKQVVQLATDLASFNNLPTEQVVKDIQSAIVGNVETLRKYGVVASEATIEQEALNSGLVTHKREIDANVKAQAILNLIVKGTADAQGDAVRTADSFANTQKRLDSQIKSLQESIGMVLNPSIKAMNLLWIDVAKSLDDTIRKSLEMQKIASAFAEGRTQELTVTERLVGFQQKIITAKEQIAYLTDENNRGMLAQEGIMQAQINTSIAAFNQQIKDAEEGIRRLKHREAVEIAFAKGKEERLAREAAAVLKLAEAERAAAIARSSASEATLTLNLEDDIGPLMQERMDKYDEATRLLVEYGNTTDMVGAIDDQVHLGIMANAEELAMAWAKAGAAAEETNAIKIQAAEVINAALVESEKATTEEIVNEYAKRAQAALSVGSTIMGGITDIANLQRQANEQTIKEAEERMRKQGYSEEQIAKATAAAKKKMFEQDKALRLAQTAMSGAQSIVSTFASAGGWPWGLIPAGIMAGLIATQMSMIASQNMPGLAKGGTIMSGGSVLVGEKGPEILNLPAGASVKPLDKAGGVIINISGNSFVGAGGVDELAQMINNSLSRQRRTGRVA